MDNEGDACVDDERLVLSEVHIGSSAAGEDADEVVSRYTYLVPSNQTDDGEDEVNSSSSSSSSGDDSDNEGHTAGRSGGSGRCSSPTRRRKRPRAGASSTSTSQRRSRPAHEVLTIVHRMATPLGLVGQQVWSAAFLLGDFVLTHPKIFAGMQVLELGAGPGVSGLIAARVARRCYLTDYHNEVLSLLARNVEANRHLFSQDGCSPTSGDSTGARAAETAKAMIDDSDSDSDDSAAAAAAVAEQGNMGDRVRRGGDRPRQVAAVRELDWFTFSQEEGPTDEAICPRAGERKKGDVRALSNGEGTQGAMEIQGNGDKDDAPSDNDDDDASFDWRKGELERPSSPLPSETGEPKPLVILAADVIYDEGLTEAFFDVLKLLMPPSPLVSPSGRRCQGAPPPFPGDDDDGRSRHDGASSEANGGAPGTNTKETGHERSRGSPRSTSATASEGDEPLSSSTQPGQSCAGSVAPLNANIDVQTDSKDRKGEEPPLGGQTSSFGAGGGGEAVLYLALEKRFNFSLAELSVSATGYKALLGNVVDVTDGVDGQVVGACASRRRAFEGVRLPLTFQQCFRYQRSDAMEIWEIRRRPM